MIKRIFSVAALSLMVAACGGDDEVETEAADGTVVNTSTDTMINRDTTMAQVVAPVVTQDTGVVQTTTTVQADTNVDVDTLRRP